MKALLKVGHSRYLLASMQHAQVILKALAEAREVDYEYERKADGERDYSSEQFCFFTGRKFDVSLEMVDERSIRASKDWVTPEVIEEAEELVTRRRGRKGNGPKLIEFQGNGLPESEPELLLRAGGAT